METIKSNKKKTKRTGRKKRASAKPKAPATDSIAETTPTCAETDVLSRGSELLNQLIRLTGMPAKTLKTELSGILERKGLDIDHLTVDDLRTVVASYLREIMSSVLDRVPSPKNNELHH